MSYCLRITDVEPIRHSLIFERFLNIERTSMPDIDIDICWAQRQRVIDYLVSRYGEERVAQIVTFNTLQAKALTQDVGRVLQIPLKEVNELKRMIPDGEVTFAATKTKMSENPIRMIEDVKFMEKLNAINDRDPRMIPAMLRLEGLHRNESLHAGGVIISRDPINQLMPTFMKGGKGRKAVQYQMDDAEAVGGLKMDMLGLKTVTLTDWAEKDVRRLGIQPDFFTRSYREDDQEAFDIINRGDTAGIFQVEGTGITRFAMDMKVESFNDIVALLALYRPGPLDSGMAYDYIKRKNGEQAVSYPHPDLEWVLKDTYGIIIYQEQVMQILGVMGGYSMGKADGMRSAMGKKDPVKMRKELDGFKEASLAKGYDPVTVESVAHLIETFARYGFNKSHSVAYGYLTYWTAVIKARYPAMFFAAWLNVTEEAARRGWIIDQAARKGIEILPPDINESGAMFTVVSEKTIRFGLGAVKGMGDSFVEKTVRSRESKGPFKSYAEYCYRLTSIPVDKKEALVASGAFDSDPGAHRAFLFKNARKINELVKNKNFQAADLDPAILYNREVFEQNIPEFTPLEAANLEKEFVSFHISADPMILIREELMMMGANVGTATEDLRGEPAIGGRITNVHPHMTKGKKPQQMAFLTIDDGIVEYSVTVFGDMWTRVQGFCEVEKAVFVRCSISPYRGKPSLSAIHIEPLELGNRNTSLVVDMGTSISPLYVAQLFQILENAERGRSGVRIWAQSDTHRFLLESDIHRISVTDTVIDQIQAVFGKDSVRLKAEG